MDSPDYAGGNMIQIWETFQSVIDFILNHIIFFNTILGIIVIFFQRKDPKSAWAWLLILYAIPIVGFILYLFLGMDLHKRKMFRTKGIYDQRQKQIQKQKRKIKKNKLVEEHPEVKHYEDLILYNLNCLGAVLEDDNKIETYTDGNTKFDALIEDIRNAEQYIHLQYYIIKKDLLFERIVKELVKKVEEGVEVRILYDAMGSRKIRKSYWKTLREKGIQTLEFFPAPFRRMHVRVNYQNHRKIAVIDGKIGYVGGYNIGKEYIDLNKRFGHWRDTHLRIEGSSARDLELRFLLDWNFSAEEEEFDVACHFQSKYKGPGNTSIQIVTSGPDEETQNIRDNYLRLIEKATKSIYIQTPYFIPDDLILNALMIAAKSGVEVNIMIPCMPDHVFVYWATYSYVGQLVAEGANCYIYEGGFLHAKGMVVDDRCYCFGTANFDIRSFCLDFEVNAMVFDKREAKKMVRIFKEDVIHCKKLTVKEYEKRSLWIRMKEQVSRLLSPVL